MEFLVLFLVERAVQVVGLAPVIAGGGKHLVVVQTFSGDDGGHGIVEVQPLVTGQGPDLIGQCAVGQWAGSHQNGGRCIDVLHLLPVDSDIFTAFHHAGHFGAECIAVHRQRTASGHAGRLGGGQQLAAHPAHFFLQQAGSRVQPLSFQAVGADQLRKACAFVCGRKMRGLLLVQVHLHALTRQPEGGFTARKTSAQNGYSIIAHLVFPLSFRKSLNLYCSFALASLPSPSAHFVRIHLPQSGRLWHSTQGFGFCQGLSLWESCRTK